MRAEGEPATPSVLTAPDQAVVVGPGRTAEALASKASAATAASSRIPRRAAAARRRKQARLAPRSARERTELCLAVVLWDVPITAGLCPLHFRRVEPKSAP